MLILKFFSKEKDDVMSAGFSIGIITILKFMLIGSVLAWVEIIQGYRNILDASYQVLAIILLPLFIFDTWFLYCGGRGDVFENRFNMMPKAKRTFLQVIALGGAVAVVVFFCSFCLFSGIVYGIQMLFAFID